MQSYEYTEAKQHLANHARNGWRHIDFFIVSPAFFEALLRDDAPTQVGRRILLPEGERLAYKGKMTQIRVYAFPLLVSDQFDLPYGVQPVTFENHHKPEFQRFLSNNLSAQMDKKHNATYTRIRDAQKNKPS